jgi:D-3-phosphoglycerate dehydrogenase / 2-oxoglutarate reductase
MGKCIAVITPIKHLNGVYELLQTKGEVFMLEEGDINEVKELLVKENIDTIFCNPNQQTYKIDKELLDGTNVTLINTCSTGMNHIDVEYCKSSGIEIYSLTNDYELINELPSTSELAFGLLIDLMRNITISNNVTKRNKTWDYLPFVGQQMKDFKVGIIGYGRLGKMMAKFCRAFDADVYIYDPYSDESNIDTLEELFDICDAVSLHVHVSDETKYMIDYQLLSRNVKFLVNTSRGEIVNESDVIRALKECKLWGYGTDVIEDEFGNIENSPFFNLENSKLNCIFTPHIGGMTIQGQTKAYKWAVNKL